MSHMAITDDDRDETGRIRIRPPAQRSLAELLPEPTAPAAAATEEVRPVTFRWRLTRSELLSVAITTLVLTAWVTMEWLRPAPASTTHAAPTAAPVATPSPIPHPPSPVPQDAYDAPGGSLLGTIPLSATIAYQHSGFPGWGGVWWDGGVKWVETTQDVAGLVDLAPPPTAQPRAPSAPPSFVPAAAPVPPSLDQPCDPQTNPRYTSPLEVAPIGRVVGASCVSQADADANALALANAMRATAKAEQEP